MRIWFRELIHFGFIILTSPGNQRTAPRYALTELPLNGNPPTRDYERWDGKPFIRRKAVDGRGSHLAPSEGAICTPLRGPFSPQNKNTVIKNTEIKTHTAPDGAERDFFKKKEAAKDSDEETIRHTGSPLEQPDPGGRKPRGERPDSSANGAAGAGPGRAAGASGDAGAVEARATRKAASDSPKGRRKADRAEVEPGLKAEFDRLWNAYPRRQTDPYAAGIKEFKDLCPADRDLAVKNLPKWVEITRAENKKGQPFWPFVRTYLADRRFDVVGQAERQEEADRAILAAEHERQKRVHEEVERRLELSLREKPLELGHDSGWSMETRIENARRLRRDEIKREVERENPPAPGLNEAKKRKQRELAAICGGYSV